MKKLIVYSICLFQLLFCFPQNEMAQYKYDVSNLPWNESLGNHRIIFHVNEFTNVVRLSVKWRRPDKNTDQHRFIIVNKETGDTIKNIHRLIVNDEYCELLLGPVNLKGDYCFYYLPYQVQEGMGGYNKDYDNREPEADKVWLDRIKNQDIPTAEVIKFEARTAFDSFYPMEVAATSEECDEFKHNKPSIFWIFPEDRKYPIRMKSKLPYKWIQTIDHTRFNGEACKNEYYTFQIGVWAGVKDLKQIKYSTTGLKSEVDEINPEAITCFNIQGVNSHGKCFIKKIGVKQNEIQPLWFGIDVRKDQAIGSYKGEIVIEDDNGNKKYVKILLRIKDENLEDRGDSELWRHSRLRWLNSSLGISKMPTSGYDNIQAQNNKFICTGRTVHINKGTALPQSIQSLDHELLSSSIRFIIETNKGEKHLRGNVNLIDKNKGSALYNWEAQDQDLTLTARIRMEFDGWLNYKYTIIPKKKLDIKDIRLEFPLLGCSSSYFIGIGLPGQVTPKYYKGKWNVPVEKINNYGISIPVSAKAKWLYPFDSFWCGTENVGIHCELKGASYTGPLLNLYHPEFPESWYNHGKGGFSINRKRNLTHITVSSGDRFLNENENLSFEFSLIITPVKKIDFRSQFLDRYYHNMDNPAPKDEDLKDGVRIINIHHANNLNPYINYPFKVADRLSDFVKYWHKRNCKVKVYYTIRELSNVASEIWAFRSLGDEILSGGNGGGYPWCREHFVENYTPQWYQHYSSQQHMNIAADASILTAAGDSRWYNYYIEGLAWLVKNTDIDGIYLDDVAFGRDMLKRMRRAMDDIKPGCLIDLHSNTAFSKGPAIQYTEYFPYIDKLWFGESFMYNRMSPENWLVEVSGIPFGLMGDMLHAGGNKWLGMQYGMTVRQPWFTEGVTCNPKYIWHLWDDFGIENSRMNAFWEKNPAVMTSDEEVKVTSYIKDGKTLLSIGNYSDKDKLISLKIDWKLLGLNSKSVKVIVPKIVDFQEKEDIDINKPFVVKSKKGWLIILEK